MAVCGCEVEIQDKSERRILITLLLINGVMFVAELLVGWWAQSTALIADALDMLADAMVYGVGLYAVGRSLLLKSHAARISGSLQVLLGLLVLVDIVRRLIVGSEPVSILMMGMGCCIPVFIHTVVWFNLNGGMMNLKAFLKYLFYPLQYLR